MRTFFDQVIANFSAVQRGTSFLQKTTGAFAYKIRQIRLRFGDPLVKFQWCGELLSIPLSHDLPRFINAFPRYNASLASVAKATARHLGRKISAIDIGANIGDTAILLLRNGAASVICIEGSPRYFALLRTNTHHLTQIAHSECILAFNNSPRNLTISETQGTGFVVVSTDTAQIPVRTLGDVLASHDRDPMTIDLVKIDTDGYDGAIIRQHAAFFTAVKPVIHFEYLFSAAGGISSAENLPDELALHSLAKAGYTRFIACTNTGDPVIYGPMSDAARMLRVLHSTDQCGVYVDIVAFPDATEGIADEIADEFALTYANT